MTPESPTAAPFTVEWQISENPDFKVTPDAHHALNISGVQTTSKEVDFTVQVDVHDLSPGTRYYYRFLWNGLVSPVGRTKTAPIAPVERMRFALVSCSNWAFGYFNVYDLLSRMDSIDFVVHCGDYIYEYPKYTYPMKFQQARHGLRPKHMCQTLADYRTRYACYRRDHRLQRLHQNFPMIAVWDDHEVADDDYVQGSAQFRGTPAEFQKRKVDGIKAFAEWVPIRGLSPLAPSMEAAHRTFTFGDLASLILVENRISHRDKPVDFAKTDFYDAVAKTPYSKWDDEKISKAATELRQELKSPERKMIGDRQVQDIGKAVHESVAAHQPWQFLVSQTVFNRIKAPNLLAALPLQPLILRTVCYAALKVALNQRIAGKDASQMARMYLGMGKYGVEMNAGSWDGFQAERQRVCDALNVQGANPIILAGDSHNAWAHEVLDDRGNRVAVEFDGPAVTSIGPFEDVHGQFQSKLGAAIKPWPLWLFCPWIEDSLFAANAETLKYCNLSERGLVVLEVTRSQVHSEYHFVNTVSRPQYQHHCEVAFAVDVDSKGRLRRVPRYMTVDGVIPARTRRHRAVLVRGRRSVGKDSTY